MGEQVSQKVHRQKNSCITKQEYLKQSFGCEGITAALVVRSPTSLAP